MFELRRDIWSNGILKNVSAKSRGNEPARVKMGRKNKKATAAITEKWIESGVMR